MNIVGKVIFAAFLTCFSVTQVPGKGLSNNPHVQRFIEEMVTQHGFEESVLTDIFGHTNVRQEIIDAITRPAEAKPWFQYRSIFVTPSRTREGAEFMTNHAESLAKAEATFGVPPEVITAIIGVESRYGRHRGKFRVMDALATLAFHYPPRAKFFRRELEQFLLLTREEAMDVLSLNGSYAGAMGQPQFIASSFRHYAVDFDGDGKRDLWHNTTDVIGSVANYFKSHGWRRGQPIASRVQVSGSRYKKVLAKGIKPHSRIKDLAEQGVIVEGGLAVDSKGALIELEAEASREYWLGLQNFYVITRYNHSALYAMAVYQLSDAIASAAKN